MKYFYSLMLLIFASTAFAVETIEVTRIPANLSEEQTKFYQAKQDLEECYFSNERVEISCPDGRVYQMSKPASKEL